MIKLLISLWLPMLLVLSCGAKERSFEVVEEEGYFRVLVGSELIYQTEAALSDVDSYDLEDQLYGLRWIEAGKGEQVSVYSKNSWSQPRPLDVSLHMKVEPRGVLEDSGLYLVQFHVPITPELRQWIENGNVKILKYIPQNSVVVHGTLEDVDNLQSDLILNKSTFEDSWKVDSDFNFDRDFFELLLVPSHPAFGLALEGLLRSLGIAVYERSHGGYFRVEVNKKNLDRLLESPFVLWVEDDNDVIGLDMDIARQQGGADFLERTQINLSAGYTGIGVRGHVLEGVDADHIDFKANEYRNAPVAIDNPTVSSHGQKTFGIIFGSGLGDPRARGMLPNAQGYYTHYAELYKREPNQDKGGRYELTKRLIEEHGIMFQSASWGYPTTREYSIRAAEMDQIIFDLDIPIMQSQSNSGGRDSRPQAWAKNIISVGGVYHYETADPGDDEWDSGKFSRGSTGPASDGRIKPDLVGYMDTTFTTNLSSSYAQFGGTSGATPMIAGHVGLIFEMWLKGDLPGLGQDKPHASTIKALLLHSSDQYPFSDSKDDLSRFHQGWGFPNLERLYKDRKSLLIIDESKPLSMNQIYSGTYLVKDGEVFKGTMVYRDPPASPGSTRARVNDLDLKFTSPSGQVFWGNFGLREGQESQPNGTPDVIDTVERIILPKAEPGYWRVEVIASEVNRDSYLASPELDASFSLVVSSSKD